MKFSVALAAILATAASACKCHDRVTNAADFDTTTKCCNGSFSKVGVIAIDGDCPANKISNNLQAFAGCCMSAGQNTDCPAPGIWNVWKKHSRDFSS